MEKNDRIQARKVRLITETLRKRGKLYYSAKGQKNSDKPPEPVSVWLVLKNNEADTGQRPLDPVNWHPPCIWVEAFDPSGDPMDRVINPQAGQSYQIAAEIHNLGYAASYSTFVEFYWVNPSPSAPSSERINMVGAPKMVAIQAGVSEIVRSDEWRPTYVNEGHECLLVRAYDPLFDPMDLASFSQKEDRHVGQRNINVEQAAPGSNSFNSIEVWGDQQDSGEFFMSATPIPGNELRMIMEKEGIKGSIPKEPLSYYGFIVRESLTKLHWTNIKDFDLKQHMKSFTKIRSRKQRRTYPLPRQVDVRFTRIIQPAIKVKADKENTERVWAVQGIPTSAQDGNVYGITITQWDGEKIVGRMHNLTVVS